MLHAQRSQQRPSRSSSCRDPLSPSPSSSTVPTIDQLAVTPTLCSARQISRDKQGGGSNAGSSIIHRCQSTPQPDWQWRSAAAFPPIGKAAELYSIVLNLFTEMLLSLPSSGGAGRIFFFSHPPFSVKQKRAKLSKQNVSVVRGKFEGALRSLFRGYCEEQKKKKNQTAVWPVDEDMTTKGAQAAAAAAASLSPSTISTARPARPASAALLHAAPRERPAHTTTTPD